MLLTQCHQAYAAEVSAVPSQVYGNVDTNVAVTLDNLNCGATYRYRVKSTASEGTVWGAYQDFTTAPCVTATADFTITGLAVSPTSPSINGTFTATVTVKNQGTVAGDGKFLDVWIHQNNQPVCGATGDQRQAVGTLAAGASTTLTFTGLPAGGAGNKKFIAFVDSDCSTTESNESNNQRNVYYAVNQPTANVDFIIFEINIPSPTTANSTVTASVTIANAGGVAGDAGFLEVSNEYMFPVCGALGVQRQALGVVAGFGVKSVTFSNFPVGNAGYKLFSPYPDSACSTAETNESNNSTVYQTTGFGRLYEVTQATGIDFVVTDLSLTPAAPTAGGTYAAVVTVKNQGTVAGNGNFLDITAATGATAIFCGWANQQPPGMINMTGFYQRQVVGTLTAGESKTYTVTGLTAPGAGMRNFRALFDSTCETGENLEANNAFTKIYPVNQVTGVDFVVTNVTLTPAAPTAGGTFAAAVTVKNQGTVAGDGKTLGIRRNSSKTDYCGLTFDQTKTVGTLAAGASVTLNFTGIAADAAGNKTFHTYVDSACGTAENDEGNNQTNLTYSVN